MPMRQLQVGTSGAKAFSDSLAEMVAAREEERIRQEEMGEKRRQFDAVNSRGDRELDFRERDLRARLDAQAAGRQAPDISDVLADPNIPDSAKTIIKLRARGVSGQLPDLDPQAAKGPRSDFDAYLGAFARELNKPAEELTAREIEQARKRYGQADDRPFAPILIQTPDGQRIVNRTPGATFDRPLTDAAQRREADASRVGQIISDLGGLSERINTKYGVEAKAVGGYRTLMSKANEDTDVAEYLSIVEAYVPIVARKLGHTGVLTEQDVERTMKAFPMPGDSSDLATRKMKRLVSIVGGGAAAAINSAAGGGQGDGGAAAGSGAGAGSRPRREDNPFRRSGG